MKTISRSILAFILALSLVTPAFAQKKVSHQQMYRIGYSGNFNLTKDWKINLKLEDRRFAFPDRQQNWILPQIYVNRILSDNWSVHLGFRYEMSNSPNAPDKPVKLTIPELRPFEGINYKQKIQKLTLLSE